jgi:Fe-S-cluster containining protein
MDRTDHCRRCGTCCKKGGPALHQKDRSAVEKGEIPLKYLYTIRKGELVWENVRGGVVPLEGELIKIKEGPDGRACTFFDAAENGCAIYDRRPVECRALKCWDTREIEAIYQRDRLRRRDLLQSVPGLWDLVASHQTECDVDRIRELEGHGEPDRSRLNRIMAYDREMRNLVRERSGLDPGILDFLFGRPLAQILSGGRRHNRPSGEAVSAAPASAGNRGR